MTDTTQATPLPEQDPPKPKRKKKRFQNRQEVINAIDDTEITIKWTNLEAEILDAFADTLRDRFQNIDLPYDYDIQKYRDKAGALRQRAIRYKTRKLVNLKRVLQTIDTPMLSSEMTGGDNSVPML